MKKLRYTGRYYLKKIKQKKMTDQQVADILEIDVNRVNKAYEEYCIERDPFRKFKFEYISTAVQIVISLISVFLVLFTLFEMQAARNATYLPNVFFGDSEVAITWDENGLPVTNDDIMDIVSAMSGEDATINKVPKIEIYNIGVGTAKDISINWNVKRNIEQFVDVLNCYEGIEIALDKNMVHIENNEFAIGSWLPDNNHIDFLLNSTEEFETIDFPFPYYELIREVYIRADSREMPSIYLSVSYSDIQGKVYSKNIRIDANVSFLMQNTDGSGFCVFDLVATTEQ